MMSFGSAGIAFRGAPFFPLTFLALAFCLENDETLVIQ